MAVSDVSATSPTDTAETPPSTSPTATAASSATHRRPGLVLAFLCLVQAMVYLDVTIVNVALPSIQRSLDMPGSNVQFVVTAYGTVLGGFLLLGGRLADTLGRRRLLQVGLVLFGAGSLLAGAASNETTMIIARGVQGLGAALTAPAALSTLTATFAEGAERNKALGIWGSLAGIASVCGVLFGGLLAHGPGWRWIFYINLPIVVAAVTLAPVVLPDSRDTTGRRRFDLAGATTLTAGLLLLIYTLNEAVDAGWASARTVGGLAGAGALLVAFVVIEQRSQSPLVPFRIFRLPSLRTANIATVFLFGAMVTLFLFASLFMQQVLGYSALKTGLAYVPLAVSVGVGAGAASGLVAKVPAKAVLAVGITLAGTGLLMLSRLPTTGGYARDVLPAFLIVGVGLGMSFVPLQIAAALGVDGREAGLAAGLINTSQEAGGALGVAIISTIAFTRVDHLLGSSDGSAGAALAAQASGYHQAFFVAACFAAAALVLTAALLPKVPSSQGSISPNV